jgi:hypothetical protein
MGKAPRKPQKVLATQRKAAENRLIMKSTQSNFLLSSGFHIYQGDVA